MTLREYTDGGLAAVRNWLIRVLVLGRMQRYLLCNTKRAREKMVKAQMVVTHKGEDPCFVPH